MQYKYETHLHTMETSRCGYVKAAEQVRRYKALGYDGICITDHLHRLYLELMDCKGDWKQCMNRYLYGYRCAREEGERIGLKVILGCELRFPEDERDYLIYGIDEKWLYDHPFITELSHEEFFKKYGKDVLIIHAHPYRDNNNVDYKCVHGIEILNGNPRHDSRNELALKLALENPDLYRLAGSDAHRDGDEGHAALVCEHEIHDSYEYKKIIESKNYKLWSSDLQDIIKKGGMD